MKMFAALFFAACGFWDYPAMAEMGLGTDDAHWSADGSRIAFKSAAGFDVFGADGARIRRVEFDMRNRGGYSISPNATRAVFFGGENGVFYFDLDSGLATQLFPYSRDVSYTNPKWSSNGRDLMLAQTHIGISPVTGRMGFVRTDLLLILEGGAQKKVLVTISPEGR